MRSDVAPEFDHMVAAFSFELSQCDDEIVVTNAIKRLTDIHLDLAKAF